MTYTLFSDFIHELLKKEGGYSNDPNDSGGETMYGVTKVVAKAYGYEGAMKDLPLSLAKQIYKEKYWDSLKLDDVQNICPSLCLKLADIAVNMGVNQAGTMLQRILNVFNNQGRYYADIKADGIVGNGTVAALRAYLAKRPQDGEMVMIRALNCMQGMFYISLAEKREKDETFVYGWLLNRVA